MDERTLRVINIAAICVAIVIILFAWYVMPFQFCWAFLLILIIFVIVGFVNVAREVPEMKLGAEEATILLFGLLLLGFAWFYMRDQFMWAILVVLLLLLFAEFTKLARWLRGITNIQVIIQRKENEGKEKAEEGDHQDNK